ncbi:MAG: zinc metallopeptidase [Oscillospiraceae bacterium]|nr:zinc metallopeptidase [Oscillospiraceae bacterium]
MGWLFYYDIYFLVLVVPVLIISLIAQVKVKTTFSKQSKKLSVKGITGAQAAYNVLSHYGITDVRIESVAGNLTDHYDPKSKVIRLSDGVYSSTSLAAIGVACHEAGHAAQHANNYVPIKIRNAIVPVCNIGSSLGLPLAIFGYILGFEPLITIGLLLYALIAVFQFITLPVEFNASRRAMQVIDETGMLYDEEQTGAKKVLTAAAMTYVTALLVSLANLLRFVLRFRGRRN